MRFSKTAATVAVFVATATILPAMTASAGVPDVVVDPGQIQIVDDIGYPTADGTASMTVYLPASAERGSQNPGLVMVHGGAWVTGKPELLDGEARAAAEEGFVVFNIDYGLSSPRNPSEQQDVESAITYILANSDQFGLDPERLGGLGTSAGAQLVMQAAITDDVPLKAVVGWSGPYDLTRNQTPVDAALTAGAAAVYLECVPFTPECTAEAAAASPALHTSDVDPAVLLFNSEAELIPAAQMTAFADNLRSHGTVVETQLLSGSRHAVAYSQDAIGPTLEFLHEHL